MTSCSIHPPGRTRIDRTYRGRVLRIRGGMKKNSNSRQVVDLKNIMFGIGMIILEISHRVVSHFHLCRRNGTWSVRDEILAFGLILQN